MTSSPFMTRAEAADYLRCSVDKMDAAIRAGKLKAAKFGRQILIRRDDVDALILLPPRHHKETQRHD